MTDNVISFEDLLKRKGNRQADPVLVRDTINLLREFIEIDDRERRLEIIEICRRIAGDAGKA